MRMKIRNIVFIALLSGCVSAPKATCDLSSVNKSQVMKNTWAEMDERYPGHAEFCATRKSADQFSFYSENGECRVYLPCGELDDKRRTLLHGDWIISFDSTSSEIKKFYDVAW
jgi:hypothetical protein